MEKFNYKDSKILVVDDIQEVLDTTRRNLKTIGIQAITMSNPIEAIEFLKENKVDMILLDYFMPQMTGEDFIQDLRSFDKQTIIYLHTGYAAEVPSDEMMDKLNIQGYIDKSKNTADIMLAIKSALKTASLLNTIHAQEEIIDAQRYKDEFFGSFTNLVVGEITNKVMTMSGAIVIMEENEKNIPAEDKEEYVKYLNNIKSATGELSELAKSVSIEVENISVERLREIIVRLLKLDLMLSNVGLNFNIQDQYVMINSNPRILVYIIIAILRELIKNKVEQINVEEYKTEETVYIKVLNEIEDEDLIIKINKLSVLDANTSIEIVDKHIVICIKNK